MSINLPLSENEQRVLALWACHQSIKDTAKCLELTPREVHYYRCMLSSKFGASNLDEATNRISQIEDYDVLTLMGQHLLVAYEMRQVQRKLALLQT